MGEKNEEFSFIEEEIVSDKKKLWKSNLGYTIGIAFFAGVIGGFSFWYLFSFFQEKYIEPEAKKISFTSPTPIEKNTEEPTEMPVQSTNKPSNNNSQEANAKGYQQFYTVIQEISEEVGTSIVTVSSVEDRTDWFNNPLETGKTCYGVMIADNGANYIILTSYNQVANGKTIKVTFSDNEQYAAELYGSDQELGIAIVAIQKKEIPEEKQKQIKIASLGESYSLTVGTPIVALGNPNGFMRSATYGMISSGCYEKYITDYKLDIFYGDLMSYQNGDGFVVNFQQEIVGVITHNFSDTLEDDVFTFIGISKLKPVIENLINKNAQVGLGIVAYDIPLEYASSIELQGGIYVSMVNTNSPAYEAGIRPDDIIVKIEDQDINSVMAYYNTINKYKEKDIIAVKVIRTGKSEKKEGTYTVQLQNKE